MLEGLNNVPQLLKEARQAVDEVSQGTRDRGAAKATAVAARGRKPGPPGRVAVSRKASAGEGGRQKKPVRAPAPPAKAVAAAMPPAAEIPEEPRLGLLECGIMVKHAIPGRIRLRLHEMLYNETLAAELPALLDALPGITSAEASAATGSLLISFSPGEMEGVKARKALDAVMRRFFPRLDTESLLRRMLGE